VLYRVVNFVVIAVDENEAVAMFIRQERTVRSIPCGLQPIAPESSLRPHVSLSPYLGSRSPPTRLARLRIYDLGYLRRKELLQTMFKSFRTDCLDRLLIGAESDLYQRLPALRAVKW
jgi:hypothetical protein